MWLTCLSVHPVIVFLFFLIVYIGLAKEFVWVFLLLFMEKPKQTLWPTWYTMDIWVENCETSKTPWRILSCGMYLSSFWLLSAAPCTPSIIILSLYLSQSPFPLEGLCISCCFLYFPSFMTTSFLILRSPLKGHFCRGRRPPPKGLSLLKHPPSFSHILSHHLLDPKTYHRALLFTFFSLPSSTGKNTLQRQRLYDLNISG